jgi:hypothetical protein
LAIYKEPVSEGQKDKGGLKIPFLMAERAE